MSLFSDVFSLPVHFEFFSAFSYCLHFAKFVCLLKRLQRLKQEWQKSPAGTRKTCDNNLFGLEKQKEISQIIKDYFYLPFFLLIILWIKVYAGDLQYPHRCSSANSPTKVFGQESNRGLTVPRSRQRANRFVEVKVKQILQVFLKREIKFYADLHELLKIAHLQTSSGFTSACILQLILGSIPLPTDDFFLSIPSQAKTQVYCMYIGPDWTPYYFLNLYKSKKKQVHTS